MLYTANRRKIRLMECNAKCSYLKKICGRCFVGGSYDPILLPPYTLYTWGEELKLNSEKVRGALVHRAGRKYQHYWLYLQSIISIKHKQIRYLGFGVFIVPSSMGVAVHKLGWKYQPWVNVSPVYEIYYTNAEKSVNRSILKESRHLGLESISCLVHGSDCTSSGSESLNSQPCPVQEMTCCRDRSDSSSSRNCHSCIGPAEPQFTSYYDLKAVVHCQGNLDNNFHVVDFCHKYL